MGGSTNAVTHSSFGHPFTIRYHIKSIKQISETPLSNQSLAARLSWLIVLLVSLAFATASAQDDEPDSAFDGSITIDMSDVNDENTIIPVNIVIEENADIVQAIFQFDDNEPQPLQAGETYDVEVNAYAFAPGEHTATLTLAGEDGEEVVVTETFDVPELPPLVELREVTDSSPQSQLVTTEIVLQPGQDINELSFQINGNTFDFTENFQQLTADLPTTDVCSDVAADAGVDEPASEALFFDEAEDVLEPEAFDYFACIVTEQGIIELSLFDDIAPISVNNFVFLAQQGFYDGTVYHRVVPDFVVQGGDRNAPAEDMPAGTGGPGYMWSLEDGAISLPHREGTLAMARAQSPDSNGSQFYITLAPQPSLDGQYNVFGGVTGENDMDIVQSIQQGDLIRTIVIVEQEAADTDE